MSIDDLETRLSGQCRNTVQYFAELHLGQDRWQGQQSERQGVGVRMGPKTQYANTVLHQLDQKIIYPHYDFKHLTEKYFEIGMKLNDFSIQLVKYCNREANQAIIIDLLSMIKRPGMENIIDYLLTSGYFTAPASTRYHNVFEGGLCQHSLNVTRDFSKENARW